jgi:hypothetical protein
MEGFAPMALPTLQLVPSVLKALLLAFMVACRNNPNKKRKSYTPTKRTFHTQCAASGA